MFSYQLYSSRNFPPLADTLNMLAALGYDGVEGYGALYADDALVAELAKASPPPASPCPPPISASPCWKPTPPRCSPSRDPSASRRIYCPYLMPDDRPRDAAGWEAFGQRLQEAGAALPQGGPRLRLAQPRLRVRAAADGACPQVAIFEGGPDLEWEIDIAWVIRGGADPLAWIAKYAPRITSVHVKDIAPEGQNADEDGWADVGQGTVDWKSLMAALQATPVHHFIMEHDNPTDHARFAARLARGRKGPLTWTPSASASSAAATSRPPTSRSRRSSAASRCAPAPT